MRLSYNKLSLHFGKTESILFGSKFRFNKEKEFKVHLKGMEVTAKTSVNYLGCTLDCNAGGTGMAQKVLGKVIGQKGSIPG